MSEQPVIPLADQIAEVGREIGMRRNVYKQFVAKGTMTQAEADRRIAVMEGVHRTLKWLQANEARVKEAVGG